jgi:hypothetical protein
MFQLPYAYGRSNTLERFKRQLEPIIGTKKPKRITEEVLVTPVNNLTVNIIGYRLFILDLIVPIKYFNGLNLFPFFLLLL